VQVSLCVNDKKEIDIIYMQTGAMKALFERYPEVLLIDGTHCVNNRRMPLYSLMVMDNNRPGRIVHYALVNSETVAIITKVMEMFKAANPKSSDLRAVVLARSRVCSMCSLVLILYCVNFMCLKHSGQQLHDLCRVAKQNRKCPKF